MSIPSVATALQAWLSMVPEVGTVSKEALDFDGVPREARGGRFWNLNIHGTEDGGGSFGTGEYAVLVGYQVRLEGWHGFSGTAQITEEWATLVDVMLSQLRAANLPPSTLGVSGLARIKDIRSSAVEVRQVRDPQTKGVYRAHHALLEFTVWVSERYSRG